MKISNLSGFDNNDKSFSGFDVQAHCINANAKTVAMTLWVDTTTYMCYVRTNNNNIQAMSIEISNFVDIIYYSPYHNNRE